MASSHNDDEYYQMQTQPPSAILTHLPPNYDRFCGQILISFGWIANDNTPRNYTTEHPLGNLEITALYSHDYPDLKLYGWGCGYTNLPDVYLEKARSMAKTLTTIDRALEKFKTEWGSPRTYGDYALRVCKAIKCRTVYRPAKWETSKTHLLNSEMPWNTYQALDLPGLIDHMEKILEINPVMQDA